jgi:beta-aspartyl-peptidase (threonine type)
MKVVLAKTVADSIAAGRAPDVAAKDAVALLGRRTGGRGGVVALDREGRPGFAFSTGNMAYAYRRTADNVTVSGLFDTGS